MLEEDGEEEVKRKKIKFFGRDLSQIPCLPNSTLFGVCSGFTIGLIYFMATSNVGKSSNVAFAAMWISFFGYWFPCRYKYETKVLLLNKVFRPQSEVINEGK